MPICNVDDWKIRLVCAVKSGDGEEGREREKNHT